MKTKYRLLGLLAACLASAFAMSGIAAGSALACSSTKIKGQGSSLQKIAQSLWITMSGCNVEYETSSSGTGRKAWGIEEPANSPEKSGDAFIASDEPLNAKQIKELNERSNGETQSIVVPVAQASVAVIVHPPAGCTITEITGKSLQEVLNTQITRWSALPKTSGTCNELIKRVVRHENSGTTFVFKTYLKEVNSGNTCSGKTWEFYAESANNEKWPEPGEGSGSSKCGGTKAIVSTGKSGSGEVKEVINTTGAIGYANLGDAREQYVAGGAYHWLKLENGSNGKFENPGTAANEPSESKAEANCEGTVYTNVPSYGFNDNWSAVNGAHAKKNAHYPICTLTYDIALHNYELAKLTNAEGLATMEYLEYVTSKTGQETLKGHDYRELEEGTEHIAKLAGEFAHLINLK
jgi:ABC-type phosphate transport system substrate-binding protein